VYKGFFGYLYSALSSFLSEYTVILRVHRALLSVHGSYDVYIRLFCTFILSECRVRLSVISGSFGIHACFE